MFIESLNEEYLQSFIAKLREYDFTSDTIYRLSGKQLTRYVRISDREEFYLLTQILHQYPILSDLVTFLLLGYPLSKQKFITYFGTEILEHFLSNKLINVEKDEAYFCAFLTPLEDNYFLNDGDPEIKPENHVFAISQEQPFLIAACNYMLDLMGKPKRILDICTGSGVIGQSIKSEGAEISGVDINSRAVSYARFNSVLNQKNSTYKVSDITDNKPDSKFDLIVSNPPYNSIVQEIVDKTEKDKTVHSGLFGDHVPNKILDISFDILNKNGFFGYIGTWLMKDGILAHPEFTRLTENGTLTLIHQPIVDILSWEGLRRLFSLSPNYRQLPKGFLQKKILEADYFNQVTWGILLYKKNGAPGFHKIYNISSDAVLLPEHVRDKLFNIYSN